MKISNKFLILGMTAIMSSVPIEMLTAFEGSAAVYGEQSSAISFQKASSSSKNKSKRSKHNGVAVYNFILPNTTAEIAALLASKHAEASAAEAKLYKKFYKSVKNKKTKAIVRKKKLIKGQKAKTAFKAQISLVANLSRHIQLLEAQVVAAQGSVAHDNATGVTAQHSLGSNSKNHSVGSRSGNGLTPPPPPPLPQAGAQLPDAGGSVRTAAISGSAAFNRGTSAIAGADSGLPRAIIKENGEFVDKDGTQYTNVHDYFASLSPHAKAKFRLNNPNWESGVLGLDSVDSPKRASLSSQQVRQKPSAAFMRLQNNIARSLGAGVMGAETLHTTPTKPKGVTRKWSPVDVSQAQDRKQTTGAAVTPLRQQTSAGNNAASMPDNDALMQSMRAPSGRSHAAAAPAGSQDESLAAAGTRPTAPPPPPPTAANSAAKPAVTGDPRAAMLAAIRMRNTDEAEETSPAATLIRSQSPAPREPVSGTGTAAGLSVSPTPKIAVVPGQIPPPLPTVVPAGKAPPAPPAAPPAPKPPAATLAEESANPRDALLAAIRTGGQGLRRTPVPAKAAAGSTQGSSPRAQRVLTPLEKALADRNKKMGTLGSDSDWED